MNNLLGLSYYDEEEEEAQEISCENSTLETKTLNPNDMAVLSTTHGLTLQVQDEDTGNLNTKNSSSKSLVSLNRVADLEQNQISPMRLVPAATTHTKPNSPSPHDFSNLVRRRNHESNYNTNTPKPEPHLSVQTPTYVPLEDYNNSFLSPQANISSGGHPNYSSLKVSDSSGTLPNLMESTDIIEMDLDQSHKELREQTLMRQLLRPKPILGLENWGIPSEPEKECDPALQAKISHFHELKEKGVHFNENLLKNKAFRNPHIYSKLVEFVELDEIGSNFPKNVFDPYGFPREMYADKLAETQKRIAEERSAAQQLQQRTQIQFVPGSSATNSVSISKSRHVMQSLAARAEKSTMVIPAVTNSLASGSLPSGKKRTSKWDVPALSRPPATSSSSTSSRSAERRHHHPHHHHSSHGSRDDSYPIKVFPEHLFYNFEFYIEKMQKGVHKDEMKDILENYPVMLYSEMQSGFHAS
ncbi:hypothetical protein G9A89_017713 [Geosiphon pyriformis]|nr:hypothetical protein G9A89_017713 [Geosiphon pyriformis]